MLKIMLLSILGPAFLFATVNTPAYTAEVEKWRHTREERLKADNGWLTLVGLSWLKEGENPIGTAESDTVVLPKHDYPAKIGSIRLQGAKAHIELRPEAKALVDGKAVTSADLKPDTTGNPDMVTLGSVSFYVIQRGPRFGVRIKDNQAETRRTFTGLKWYPVNEQYRVTAKWVPFDKPRKLVLDSIIGEKEVSESPGYAEFTLNGKQYKLQPSTEEDYLFFVFRDTTAGKTTYPAARFLTAKMPKDGTIILDFNKAYNPPCAFTPYATCPLPSPENRLPIAIEAGEKMYGKHSAEKRSR